MSTAIGPSQSAEIKHTGVKLATFAIPTTVCVALSALVSLSRNIFLLNIGAKLVLVHDFAVISHNVYEVYCDYQAHETLEKYVVKQFIEMVSLRNNDVNCDKTPCEETTMYELKDFLALTDLPEKEKNGTQLCCYIASKVFKGSIYFEMTKTIATKVNRFIAQRLKDYTLKIACSEENHKLTMELV